MDENTLIAWEMNGQPLPHWNGAPARIVVPGWTATYWMKQVVNIRVLAQPLAGFWMAKAYRVPKGKFATVDRFTSQETAENTPITEIVVNSLVTNVTEGQKLKAGAPLVVKGHRLGRGLWHPLRRRLGGRGPFVAVGRARSRQRAVIHSGRGSTCSSRRAAGTSCRRGRRTVSGRRRPTS